MKNNNSIFNILVLISILFISTVSVSAGDIFKAEVYLQGTDKGELLFYYENEIKSEGDNLILTHNYLSVDRELFAQEELILNNGELVQHRTDFYPIKEYSLLNRVEEGIEISFKSDSKQKSKIIPYQSDIVYGPTQQQYIRDNLSKFQNGEVLKFILPAPEFTITTSFTMRKVDNTGYERPGVTVLQMGTRNLLLKLMIGKNQFVVDEKDGTILEIHGPSVLRRLEKGKWKFVDVDIYFKYLE